MTIGLSLPLRFILNLACRTNCSLCRLFIVLLASQLVLSQKGIDLIRTPEVVVDLPVLGPADRRKLN